MKKDVIKYLEKKEFNITELNLSNYKLKEIPDLSKFINLEILNLSNNEITDLTNIPTTIHTLIVTNNRIEQIINIPLNIKVLHIDKNLLKELDISNTNIEKLYCDKNILTSIKYSINLELLVCSHNKIINLDNLPNTLIDCDCSYNKIKYLTEIYEKL